MSKRKRRNRRSVLLRAGALPLCMGLAASFGIAAFGGPDAGFKSPVHKADRLAGKMTVWTKPFQVASLRNDWMLHIVPAEINGKPVLLAQADMSTPAPAPDTVTTLGIAPASAADDTATQLDKLALEAQLTKGYADLARKDYKAARKIFADAVETHGNRADLWRQLGYIKLGLGKKDEALKAFEKANEIAPGDPKLEAQTDQLKYAPVIEDGYKKLKVKDFKGALKIFQTMVQKQPKRSDLWKQIAFIQTNLGNSVAAATAFDKSSAIDSEKVAEAKKTQEAKIDKKIEDAYTALCSKDFTKARQAYMEAVKIDPMRADLWQQLGSVETNLGDIKAASRAFDRARSLKSSN